MLIDWSLIMKKEYEIKNGKGPNSRLKFTVDIYPLAEGLFDELESKGFINRLERVPQLGDLPVKEKNKKSRYDYIMLQMYFYGIIKNMNHLLKYSMGSKMSPKEIKEKLGVELSDTVTVADILQLLSIAYNVGHFNNTFAASHAAVRLANENDEFRQTITDSIYDNYVKEHYANVVEDINYYRFHLLNSLIILSECNQELTSVLLTKRILLYYLKHDKDPDCKLCYVFNVFKEVRNVAFIAFDLQVTKTVPLELNINNTDSLEKIFFELLSEYNDESSTVQLIHSLNKLLDDTLYNRTDNVICRYEVTEKMLRELRKIKKWDKNSYIEMITSEDSVFNKKHSKNVTYITDYFLKLTFKSEENKAFKRIVNRLQSMNHISVGYYDRHYGESTIVVSLKKTCKCRSEMSFKVLKVVVNAIKELEGIDSFDDRYLLATKFFLYHYFGGHKLRIVQTVDRKKCVFCLRGRNNRVKELERLLSQNYGNDDQRHEVQYLISRLKEDGKNDLCIVIPGSIVAFEKKEKNTKKFELDGLIIYPNRGTNQIVFMEAKNKSAKPMEAVKCLKKSLGHIGIVCSKDDIKSEKYDAYFIHSI